MKIVNIAASPNQKMNHAATISSFNHRFALFLRRIEIRRATDEQARAAIFRLRYRGYLRDGGIGPNPQQSFSDSWDDVDNAQLFGLYIDGELASSVRMHIAGPGGGAMPALETFGDVLAPYVAAGKRMLDPTRFVIDEKFARIGPEPPFATLRLVAMAAEHYNVDIFLATVRAEHAIMYKRLCGHRAISEPRVYPLLAKPIVCMAVEVAEMREKMYARHLFFESSEEERLRVFGPSTDYRAVYPPSMTSSAPVTKLASSEAR